MLTVTVTNLTSRNVIISWQVDSIGIPINELIVHVTEDETGQIAFFNESVPVDDLMLTLMNLQPTTTYQLSITPLSTAGAGEEVSIKFTTISDG